MVLMIGMTTMRNQYTGRQLMVRLNSITCPYCTTPLEIETLSDGKSKELRKKIDEIIMRDYSYLSMLMEDVAGAQPETITTRRKKW